tara:strand:- start:17782 stop:18423 length:642 start_codon:yes stop_codon:yes gene_type:complete
METTLRARHDLHLMRKAWHMLTGSLGLITFLTFNIEQHLMGVVLVAFALSGFLFEAIRLRNSAINQKVLSLMGPLMRSSEQNSCSGLPFYALGVGASLLLFERDQALLSILFLIFADPISSLFGILFGSHKLISGKSLEGSMAGFITCYLITFMWINIQTGVSGANVVVFCILAGLIGAASELSSVFADDNLTIPLLSGAGLTAINILIPVLI